MTASPLWRTGILTLMMAVVPLAAAQDDAAAQDQESTPPQQDQAQPAEAQQPAAATPAFDPDKVGYAMGVKVAQTWRQRFEQDGLDVSNERMIAGFRDALTGEELEMDEAAIEQAMIDLQMELRRVGMARMQQQAQENMEEGQAFLEKNAQREGVVVTDSGLQYEIIEEGEGTKPEMGDQVTVHYTGTLVDGTVFDSSVNPPQPGRPVEPATFTLGQVIEGWNEGLTHIAPGGQIRLYIPPDLAYGMQPRGNVIGPNSTLIFDIQLLNVEEAGRGQNAEAEGTTQAGDGGHEGHAH